MEQRQETGWGKEKVNEIRKESKQKEMNLG